MTTTPLSIPSLARRLGVTPPAVRNWIRDGVIAEPSTLTATGEHAYHPDAVEAIEMWYATRASTHSTRGPGATQRRKRAHQLLSEKDVER